VSSIAPVLLTALGLGFLGSSHCLAMCGGIAGALGMGTGTTAGGGRFALLAGFSAGRITSYAVIGLLLGGLVQWGAGTASTLLTPLRLLAGLLLVAMGLYVAGWWRGLTRLEALAMPLWHRLQPFASRLLPVHSLTGSVALGAIWGWLPCGLVYSTLAWATTSGSAVVAALGMLAFGLGTLPAMLGMTVLGERLGRLRRAATFRYAAGVMLILFGVWTAWAAVPLHSTGEHHAHHHGPSAMQ